MDSLENSVIDQSKHLQVFVTSKTPPASPTLKRDPTVEVKKAFHRAYRKYAHQMQDHKIDNPTAKTRTM